MHTLVIVFAAMLLHVLRRTICRAALFHKLLLPFPLPTLSRVQEVFGGSYTVLPSVAQMAPREDEYLVLCHDGTLKVAHLEEKVQWPPAPVVCSQIVNTTVLLLFYG